MGKKMTKAEKEAKAFEDARKELAKPHKAPKPRTNKLYFYEQVSKSDGKTRHGWRLASMNGKIIGGSTELYSKKIYAIRNAITLFGKELWAGIHIVPDEADNALVLKEGVAQDEKRKAKTV